MNVHLLPKIGSVFAGMLLVATAQAAMITKADYKAGKSRINAEYKSEKAACGSMAGNAKDVCVEEAKAKEKVALAELEFSFTGKSEDRNKVLVAKAKTNYAVAKEKCDDKAGNDKDVCVKEAKAVEVKALADAKLGKDISDARKDTADEKRDADFKVAIEKCDAFAGDAKSTCVAAAKSKFGKN
jgi:hypothetical protein